MPKAYINGVTLVPAISGDVRYSVETVGDGLVTVEVLDADGQIVGKMPWNFADFNTCQGPMRVGGNRKDLFSRDRCSKMAAHYFRQRWENFKK